MANQYRSVLASGGASTGGDALPAEVLSGKTFTNDNGAQTGAMVNNGAISQTLAAGQSYTVPEGYHNGNGTVTAEGVTVAPTNLTYSGSDINVEVGKIYAIYISASGPVTITGGTVISGAPSGETSGVFIIKATASIMTITGASDWIARAAVFTGNITTI